MAERDLKADLAICDAASPGPWEAFLAAAPADFFGRQFALVSHRRNADGDALGRFVPWPGDDRGNADATFAAAAREGWPEAIRRALAAEAEVERLQDMLDEDARRIDR